MNKKKRDPNKLEHEAILMGLVDFQKNQFNFGMRAK